jgi:hypothetical protein
MLGEAVVEPAPCTPGASWAPCITVNDCEDIQLLKIGRCDPCGIVARRSEEVNGPASGTSPRPRWPAQHSGGNDPRQRPERGRAGPRRADSSVAVGRGLLQGTARTVVLTGPWPLNPAARPPPARPRAAAHRFSAVHVAGCAAASGRVAIKVYDRPALSARKRNMATREAIILKHLNACGCAPGSAATPPLRLGSWPTGRGAACQHGCWLPGPPGCARPYLPGPSCQPPLARPQPPWRRADQPPLGAHCPLPPPPSACPTSRACGLPTRAAASSTWCSSTWRAATCWLRCRRAAAAASQSTSSRGRWGA